MRSSDFKDNEKRFFNKLKGDGFYLRTESAGGLALREATFKSPLWREPISPGIYYIFYIPHKQSLMLVNPLLTYDGFNFHTETLWVVFNAIKWYQKFQEIKSEADRHRIWPKRIAGGSIIYINGPLSFKVMGLEEFSEKGCDNLSLAEQFSKRDPFGEIALTPRELSEAEKMLLLPFLLADDVDFEFVEESSQ